MERSRIDNLEEQKQKIVEFIKIRGPTITIKVSNYLKVDSLIASAFLADLLADKLVKMSFMKVGNSPVYYIPGQEFQLEDFSHYLSGKEKEAFEILKREGVLQDEKQLPAIRVSLRNLKDFAFPFEYNGNLYWRYLKTGENEAYDLINSGKANFSQLPPTYRPIQLPIQSQIQDVQIPVQETIEQPIQKVQEPKKPIEEIEPELKIINDFVNIDKANVLESKGDFNVTDDEINVSQKIKTKSKKSKSVKKNMFIESVESFLVKEGITIMDVIKKGQKEYQALVSINSSDGERKNEYLCIAKEKKSISDRELMKNLQIGQKKNLPVLFVTSGEASKKAIEWLDYLGNIIIYKKLE
ncbi:MAG: hypothetical protein QXI33_02760 [Candidatus Pacearchaeota archaeon]